MPEKKQRGGARPGSGPKKNPNKPQMKVLYNSVPLDRYDEIKIAVKKLIYKILSK